MKKILGIILGIFMLGLLFISPVFAGSGWESKVLLNNVTATGASDVIRVDKRDKKTFYIIPSGVSTGGTVLIQTSPNAADWATIATVTVTDNTPQEVAVSGLLTKYMRVNLSARSDGTYYVIAGYSTN